MIIDESQITKEKREEGETWTTPWRMTRSEAYVDLVDATDYAQRYGEKAGMKAEATLEDEWEQNRHRAQFTFGKVQDKSETSLRHVLDKSETGEKDAGTESEAAIVRPRSRENAESREREESSEADSGSGDKK